MTPIRQPQVEGRQTRLGLRGLLPVLLVFLACSADRVLTSATAHADLPAPEFTPKPTPVERPPAPTPIEPTLASSSEPALPEPATPEQIADAIADAEQQIRELGIRAKLRRAPAGPLPELALLDTAYAEQRAFSIAGSLAEVREWMALAKFGTADNATALAAGPLAHYDLLVTRDDERAWLHVVVPARGLASERLGRHEAFVEGERWINLADRIAPDQHYRLYKTNGNESLDRQWGRVEVIEALATIADEYRQRTGQLLGIGDISHVTGGKIPDHWTHREGVDADLYLLDHEHLDDEGRPSVWWHHSRKDRSIWSSEPQGKGEREPRLDPEDELSDTPSSQRLRVLAQIVFPLDPVAYFVHDDPVVLASFDREVGERRPGRRYLHAKNRGMWPRHCDHVHLRWVEGSLPTEGTPRP
ncbi:penicillin-insensitive murein endopeptidase [Nannocystaceae bacterium ST9]